MLIKKFVTPGLAAFTYLLYDEQAKKGAVIDPTCQIDPILAFARQENIDIIAILETHVHADFVSGAPELKQELANHPLIYSSGLGGKEWIPLYADKILKNHDMIVLGQIKLEALHTPGHTPEHVIYLAYDSGAEDATPKAAFTGDLLFAGSVGRPDLLGKRQEETLAQQLHHSLFSILSPLADALPIYPAHGAGSLCGKGICAKEVSTLGEERRSNPWFSKQSYEDWRKHLLEAIPSAPAYFRHMKDVNVGGSPINSGKPTAPIITANEVKEHTKALVVDVRPPEAFAKKHIKGSVNLPPGPSFPVWAGIAIASDRDIILAIEKREGGESIVKSLHLVGIDHIIAFTLTDQWPQTGEMFTTLPTINPEMLQERAQEFYVLDVRTPEEWNSGHVAGSHHIELANVPASIDRMPKDQPIAVLCRSGTRASLATSLLAFHGLSQAMNVPGGIIAWQKAGLPLQK